MYGDENEPVELSPKGRKRKIIKENHSHEVKKKNRHSGQNIDPKISCSHVNTFCKADLLTADDLQYNKELFYKGCDKQHQDDYILRQIDCGSVKRERVKPNNRKKTRNCAVRYFVYKRETEAEETGERKYSKVQVCRSTFLSIYGEHYFYFIF